MGNNMRYARSQMNRMPNGCDNCGTPRMTNSCDSCDSPRMGNNCDSCTTARVGNNCDNCGNTRVVNGCDDCRKTRDELRGMPLAMAYVPWQEFECTYEPMQALRAGTIFPELDKPFYGRRGMR